MRSNLLFFLAISIPLVLGALAIRFDFLLRSVQFFLNYIAVLMLFFFGVWMFLGARKL